ncbi:Plasmodium variant antigen protein Cir/Yir/Bir, putative [Plasmodium chabaudi adami]|uniref:Plasmodium variant antigen protein Cir/Yir/Bir, putative n=1 Tax=Plasmodium chabaudi adami TaxID=5826 RepID=A0A1C6WEE1_PLACE|nr:Plasmodium variant antigen protein Cir/Yir/Bir, putative [Plasmodium chabaudi adami]
MSKEVCTYIHTIDNLIKVEKTDKGVYVKDVPTLKRYCPNNIYGRKRQPGEDGYCAGYVEFLSAAAILLLKYFKVVDDLKNDITVEYAILWLGYKLNQYPQRNITTLNDFYTKNIKTNACYNDKITNSSDSKTYMDIIDKKQCLMHMDINTISNFYEALEILCKMYTAYNENNKKCTNCSKNAEEFLKKFKKLNENSNNTDGSPYRQIMSTLSTDYNNFKNDCGKNSSECTDLPELPEIKSAQCSVEISMLNHVTDNAEGSVKVSEATPSRSSTANKLIPALSIFVAIPIFLGIAYKYSLFGFDKRVQRIYSREKVKKIKNEMNHYI